MAQEHTIKLKATLDSSQAKSQLRQLNQIAQKNTFGGGMSGDVGRLLSTFGKLGTVALAVTAVFKTLNGVAKHYEQTLIDGAKNLATAVKEYSSFSKNFQKDLLLKQASTTFDPIKAREYAAIAQRNENKYYKYGSQLNDQMKSLNLTPEELENLAEVKSSLKGRGNVLTDLFSKELWAEIGNKASNAIGVGDAFDLQGKYAKGRATLEKLERAGVDPASTADFLIKTMKNANDAKTNSANYQQAAEKVLSNIASKFTANNMSVSTNEISRLASIGGFGANASYRDTIPDKLDDVQKILQDIKDNTRDMKQDNYATYGE